MIYHHISLRLGSGDPSVPLDATRCSWEKEKGREERKGKEKEEEKEVEKGYFIDFHLLHFIAIIFLAYQFSSDN